MAGAESISTTPPRRRWTRACGRPCEPYLDGLWGNPSSLHWEGRQAREAVEAARPQVAALLGAEPGEIVFTGSGTEADNMALWGVVSAAESQPCHVVTSAIEHPAVLECCSGLRRLGVEATLLPVSGDGIVDPADLRRAIRPDTRLVSVMAANNVLGTLQPVAELARVARANGILFHTDAVQAAGKIPLDVRSLPIDLLSLSAHKLHGPKGVGALYVRKGVKLTPLLAGGGQEKGLPLGHGERGGDCRPGRGGRDRPNGNGRRGRPAGANSRLSDRIDSGVDRQCVFHRPPLSPLAGPRLSGVRRHGRRGDQALAGAGRDGDRDFVGQRVQRATTPASLRTCCRRSVRIRFRPAARCGSHWGGSTPRRRPGGSWKCCPRWLVRCGRCTEWSVRSV